jgi:hypothetical protein
MAFWRRRRGSILRGLWDRAGRARRFCHSNWLNRLMMDFTYQRTVWNAGRTCLRLCGNSPGGTASGPSTLTRSIIWRGGIGAIKKIYDFLAVKVIFTSSVALRIHEAAHDLARRVRLYQLEYFSFREYLAIRHGSRLRGLELGSLLAGEVPAEYLRATDRFEGYLAGGVIPFALEEPEPLPLLASTIESIVTSDIPAFCGCIWTSWICCGN